MLHDLIASFQETDLPYSFIVAQEKSKYLHEKLGGVTAGADTVFWIWSDSHWQSLSKLERLQRSLTVPEIIQQYHFLYQVLCQPQDGLGRVVWDISLAFTYHKDKSEVLNERIYLEYYPLDKEIFKFFGKLV